MKKPWTIAATSHIVTEGLERKCDGTHAHVEARGKDCKLAEDYTDAFARQVHVVLARVAERVESFASHDVCAAAVSSPELGRVGRRRAPPRFAPRPPCCSLCLP